MNIYSLMVGLQALWKSVWQFLKNMEIYQHQDSAWPYIQKIDQTVIETLDQRCCLSIHNTRKF